VPQLQLPSDSKWKEIANHRTLKKYTLVVAMLVAFLCVLHPVTSSADEAADIARVLELNDAYAKQKRAHAQAVRAESAARERQAIAAERAASTGSSPCSPLFWCGGSSS
jgi:hypothetical protein